MDLLLLILVSVGLKIIDIYIMIELLIMGCTINTIYVSNLDQDMVGQVYSLIQILIAGIESAIGLSIFVSYNRRIDEESIEEI